MHQTLLSFSGYDFNINQNILHLISDYDFNILTWNNEIKSYTIHFLTFYREVHELNTARDSAI